MNHLAIAQNNLGQCLAETGQSQQGATLLRTACKCLEKLVDEHPTSSQPRVSLGNTYSALGQLESQQGNQQAALHCYDKAVQNLQAVLKSDPRQTFARKDLHEAYQKRMLALARMGRHASAMRDVESLGGQKVVSASDLYNLACVCSLCSVAVRCDAQLAKTEQDRRAEQYTAHAVEFLKKAKAAGFFQSAARIEEMRKDKDLDALRGRQDFQALMLSLQPKGIP